VQELPLAQPFTAPGRRDALRNRERVLAAAEAVLGRCGPDGLDVRSVAAEAGVGIGTLYRRFGDRTGLMAALLDARTIELQDTVLRGPPPVGPGAPPRDRLVAFLQALVTLTEQQLELLLAVEASRPLARFEVGAYGAWRLHTAILLRDVCPGLDAGWFAELLLGALDARTYAQQRRLLGLSPEDVMANLERAVDVLSAGVRG
jgi:AcrR family transcriptional regulator